MGATTETIEENASTAQLQTEDAVTGQVVNRKFINDLPLIDRGVFDLASLVPGVVPTNIPGSGSPINFNSNGRGPVSDVGASNFGQITRTIANRVDLQLALKWYGSLNGGRASTSAPPPFFCCSLALILVLFSRNFREIRYAGLYGTKQ